MARRIPVHVWVQIRARPGRVASVNVILATPRVGYSPVEIPQSQGAWLGISSKRGESQGKKDEQEDFCNLHSLRVDETSRWANRLSHRDWPCLHRVRQFLYGS